MTHQRSTKLFDMEFEYTLYKLYSICCLVLILGCANEKKQETTGSFEITPSGYNYYVFKKGEGRKVEVGEYACFNVIEIMDDTILVRNSYVDGRINKLGILPYGQMSQQIGPIMEVLRELHVGDSVSYRVTAAELNIPPEAFRFNHIEYIIKLEYIQTREEYEEEKKQFEEKLEHRKDSIKALELGAIDFAKTTVESWQDQEVETTPAGVEYIIHQEGDGKLPLPGEPIALHFVGIVEGEGVFDNSFQSGLPFVFPFKRGSVIKGWDDVFDYIIRGSKVTMRVPYTLAYGEAGSPPLVPERANLYFYVEVEKNE